MSYSVDWITKIITVPTSDLTLVSGTRYSLDMADFLTEIRRLEWGFIDGLWAPAILDHSDTRFDFAGVNYAPFDDIVNGYTVVITGAATRVDLLGSNNNLVDVLISNGVTVVPSNSAGLQIVSVGSGLSVEEQIQLGEVHGQVRREIWLDPSLGINGNGYQQSPYNNLTDAIDDAEVAGVTSLVILDDITLNRNLKNFVVRGVGLPVIDFAGYDLKGCEFKRMKLQGSYIDQIIAQECRLLTNLYLNGHFEKCALAGDLICTDGGEVFMDNSASAIAGLGRPTISMNGVGSSKLSIRGHGGGLTVKDCNNPSDEVTVEMGKIGSLTFDASCTDGQMVARTNGKFVDNTNGAQVEREVFIQDMWQVRGLDKVNPAAIKDDSVIAGDVTLAITDDGTTTTVQRQ